MINKHHPKCRVSFSGTKIPVPENAFEFRISGPEVSPGTVELRAVLEVLANLEKAIAATAADAGLDAESTSLNLVGICEGSSIYRLKGSRAAISSTSRIVTGLRDGNLDAIPVKARINLQKVWKALVANGWDACEFSGNGAAIGNAAIRPDCELFAENLGYRGVTTLYGQCTGVGGVSRTTAKLTLLDDTKRTVGLASRELAQELGRRLYQHIGGEGDYSGSDESE